MKTMSTDERSYPHTIMVERIWTQVLRTGRRVSRNDLLARASSALAPRLPLPLPSCRHDFDFPSLISMHSTTSGAITAARTHLIHLHLL